MAFHDGEASVAVVLRTSPPPHPDRPVRRAAAHQLAGRRQAKYRSRVPSERARGLHAAVAAAGALPDDNGAVARAGVEHLAVGSESERVHRRPVALHRADQRVLPLPGAAGPRLDLLVGRARVHAPVGGDRERVDGVVVRRRDGLHAPEAGQAPHLDAPVPRRGVEERAVRGHRERGDRVHVVHPGAPPVPPDLHVAPRQQARPEAVHGGREHRAQDELRPCLAVPPPATGTPRPDLAVLVGAQEEPAIARGEERLDGAVGVGDRRAAAAAAATVILLLLLLTSPCAVQCPQPDAPVRRGDVQRVTVDGESGDVRRRRRVAFDRGDELVERRACVQVMDVKGRKGTEARLRRERHGSREHATFCSLMLDLASFLLTRRGFHGTGDPTRPENQIFSRETIQTQARVSCNIIRSGYSDSMLGWI
ncbi:Os02g0740800, partial [Oryza sativa Japonica Group]